jgi:excisionase family DNA binding protein
VRFHVDLGPDEGAALARLLEFARTSSAWLASQAPGPYRRLHQLALSLQEHASPVGSGHFVDRAPEDLLDQDEVAELLGLSVSSIYRARQRGELPVVQIEGRIKFRVGDVEAFIASHRKVA